MDIVTHFSREKHSIIREDINCFTTAFFDMQQWLTSCVFAILLLLSIGLTPVLKAQPSMSYPSPPASFYHQSTIIYSGTPVEVFDFNVTKIDSSSLVSEVRFSTISRISNFKIDIYQLSSFPTGALQPKGIPVLIFQFNLDPSVDALIQSAQVTFQVPLSRISSLGVDNSTIQVESFTGTDWIGLWTISSSSNSQNLFLSILSTKLSLFALMGKQATFFTALVVVGMIVSTIIAIGAVSFLVFRNRRKSLSTGTPTESKVISFTKALGDGFSHIEAKVVSFTKNVRDSISLSEVIMVGKRFSQALSDALTLAESVIKTATKALGGSAALAESLVKQKLKTLSDSITVTEFKVITFTKSLFDILALRETKIFSFIKSLSDSIASNEATRIISSWLRNVFDNITLIEGKVINFTKNATDSLTLSELIAVRKKFAQALSDTVTFAGRIASSTAKALGGAIILAKSFIRQKLKTLSDTITLVESKVITFTKSVADSLSLTQVISSLRTIRKALSDSITLTESKAITSIKALLEGITVSGNKVISFIKRPYGLFSPSKGIQTLMSKIRALFNSITLTEQTQLRLTNAIRFFADTITLAGSRLTSFAKSIYDSFAQSEVVAKTISKVQQLLHGISFTESKIVNFAKVLFHTFTSIESIDIRRMFYRYLRYTICIGEKISAVLVSARKIVNMRVKSFRITLSIKVMRIAERIAGLQAGRVKKEIWSTSMNCEIHGCRGIGTKKVEIPLRSETKTVVMCCLHEKEWK